MVEVEVEGVAEQGEDARRGVAGPHEALELVGDHGGLEGLGPGLELDRGHAQGDEQLAELGLGGEGLEPVDPARVEGRGGDVAEGAGRGLAQTRAGAEPGRQPPWGGRDGQDGGASVLPRLRPAGHRGLEGVELPAARGGEHEQLLGSTGAQTQLRPGPEQRHGSPPRAQPAQLLEGLGVVGLGRGGQDQQRGRLVPEVAQQVGRQGPAREQGGPAAELAEAADQPVVRHGRDTQALEGLGRRLGDQQGRRGVSRRGLARGEHRLESIRERRHRARAPRRTWSSRPGR
ncbi:hypothetical protein PPSIR1_11908 [Plesiocystis pacifica SIR-1]|uniref:Uncharacterized protein n=1 Tax=Plesiocystis pacifica SIR-1 TaxID=391625 RepID=A6GIG8_9BACT|nr:hypothetical protein [Plesiocystis pacifica]EDM74331.1 hypothetical protein PPSIR1_11908 [Plesiocystis pacifica SIR-1]